MGDKFGGMEVIFGLGNEWNIEFYGGMNNIILLLLIIIIIIIIGNNKGILI